MIFWHKRKIDSFDPYNVLLAIATNIPVTYDCFLVQGHIYIYYLRIIFVYYTYTYFLSSIIIFYHDEDSHIAELYMFFSFSENLQAHVILLHFSLFCVSFEFHCYLFSVLVS